MWGNNTGTSQDPLPSQTSLHYPKRMILLLFFHFPICLIPQSDSFLRRQHEIGWHCSFEHFIESNLFRPNLPLELLVLGNKGNISNGARCEAARSPSGRDSDRIEARANRVSSPQAFSWGTWDVKYSLAGYTGADPGTGVYKMPCAMARGLKLARARGICSDDPLRDSLCNSAQSPPGLTGFCHFRLPEN